jgi:hypothetical protein
MSDLQPEIAARFGTHLWFREFKARIGLTTVAEIPPEQPKIEKIYAEEEGLRFIFHTVGKRKGWTISERTDKPDTGAGMICRLSNKRWHDTVFGVLPEGGGIIPSC